jgi:hypothetical protein
MQARLGIPIPHPLYSVPRRYAADFAVTPVLGPVDGNGIEMLELKGPPEQLLNTGKCGWAACPPVDGEALWG